MRGGQGKDRQMLPIEPVWESHGITWKPIGGFACLGGVLSWNSGTFVGFWYIICYSNVLLCSWNSIAEPAGGTRGYISAKASTVRTADGSDANEPQYRQGPKLHWSNQQWGSIFCSHADDAHHSWFRSRSESQSSRPDQYEHCRSSGQARGVKGRKGARMENA